MKYVFLFSLFALGALGATVATLPFSSPERLYAWGYLNASECLLFLTVFLMGCAICAAFGHDTAPRPPAVASIADIEERYGRAWHTDPETCARGIVHAYGGLAVLAPLTAPDELQLSKSPQKCIRCVDDVLLLLGLDPIADRRPLLVITAEKVRRSEGVSWILYAFVTREALGVFSDTVGARRACRTPS